VNLSKRDLTGCSQAQAPNKRLCSSIQAKLNSSPREFQLVQNLDLALPCIVHIPGISRLSRWPSKAQNSIHVFATFTSTYVDIATKATVSEHLYLAAADS
jgi:hypothetical protein